MKCKQCGMTMATANTRMLKYWVARSTGAVSDQWETRLRKPTSNVCMKCDAYALGAEFKTGMAVCATVPSAFLTVNDWDWWNSDPADCDPARWPRFGRLHFSASAMSSTVEYLRETFPEELRAQRMLVFEKALSGVVGISGEKSAGREWAKLMDQLQAETNHVFTKPELNAAVRLLAGTLA